MQLGVVLPGQHIPADPSALADFAQAVEDLGYSHLVTLEHVAGADLTNRPDWEGRTTLEDFHEPLVLFGFLAGRTRRLELVTDVLVLSQRQTVLVAQQAAEVDLLSNGRLRLGVGVGWVEPEFRALNEDYHTRGARLDEQIAVLRALWTQESLTFHGRWHHIEEMGIRPRPRQRPIPIWLAGHVEASYRRIGTLGDGWMSLFDPIEEAEEARQAIERIHGYARTAGRDPHRIGIEAVVPLPGRTPDDWLRDVAGWRALGATHLVAGLGDAGIGPVKGEYTGIASLKAHIDLIQRFKEVAGAAEHTDVSISDEPGK